MLDKRSREGTAHSHLASGEPLRPAIDSSARCALEAPPDLGRDLLRVAFGDRPGAPVRVGPDDDPGHRWLAAVVLGARGRYGAAAALLERLVAEPSVPPAVRAHAAVTRAAHLRQAGGHREARRWDGLGLALATGTEAGGSAQRSVTVDDRSRRPGRAAAGTADPAGPGLDRAGARADALLGLAADALGLAELDLADRLLDRACPDPLAAGGPWRTTVRACWVRAELALCRDHPEQARDWAARALAEAERACAGRHAVKSTLVLAVAEAAAGYPAVQVINLLSSLSERTHATGLLSLEWPIQLQLGELTAATDPAGSTTHRSQAFRILASVHRHADPLVRKVLGRSPWVPDFRGPGLLH